jgi:hypothetical protein
VTGELLGDLRASNQSRIDALSVRGYVMPGLEEAKVSTMVEVLLGDRLAEAQLLHEQRVAEMLDVNEVAADEDEVKRRQEAITGPGAGVHVGDNGRLQSIPGRGGY